MYDFIYKLLFTILDVPNIETSDSIIDMLFFYSFLIIPLLIGVVVIKMVISYIIKKDRVEKHGVVSYGIVDDVILYQDSEGTSHEICFAVIDVDTNTIRHFTQMDPGIIDCVYKLNDYVLCKYYEDDFIIINKINENDIPKDYKVILDNNKKEK